MFTAAKFLDSEYIKDEHTIEEREEFREVLLKMAKTPGCKWDIGDFMTEWAGLQTALATEGHGLDSNEAFSKKGCLMASWEWASVDLLV